MLILIFDSGEIKKASSMSDEYARASFECILEIVDISNPNDPKYYNPRYYDEDCWVSIESVDEYQLKSLMDS